jgi:hypothetical protein
MKTNIKKRPSCQQKRVCRQGANAGSFAQKFNKAISVFNSINRTFMAHIQPL